MFSFKTLLSALALTLLAASVESWCDDCSVVEQRPDVSRRDEPRVHEDEDDDDDDYDSDSPVLRADRMVRPLRSLKSAYGPISHSGVRVTLEDGAQWLIHKGNTNGVDSPMVVTSAEHMSSKWKSVETREMNGRKTVGDFVKAGGDSYHILRDDCHDATDAMMSL